MADQLSKFDRRIENLNGPGTPARVQEAAIYVNDTLELAWFSAQEVFGNDAKPEHALAIYALIDAERLRRIESDEE